MATWAIGDIQGCYETLRRLVDRLDLDARVDRLWLVGDLVNRGPASVSVLRWAMGAGSRVVAVLGNHDLKLLALAEGLWQSRSGDTLDDVLEAPDRDELLGWLASRPLAHARGEQLMIHAGLQPAWTGDEALRLAEEVSEALKSPPDRRELLLALKRHPPRAWDSTLTGMERLACVTHALTRLRTATAEGEPCEDFTGHPDDAPAGCRPWFELKRASSDREIVFGHWSALGFHRSPGATCLDTGCVWGRSLTAMCLEDGRVISEPSAEKGVG